MANTRGDAQTRAEPIRVLLVEDHEHVLWGLAKLVDGEWPRMMVIGTARSVVEATAVMQERKPDVVVLDINLGEVNSVDHLAAMARVASAEIVVLTGVADAELHRRAIDSGAAAVLMKEAPAEHLLRQIEQAHLTARHDVRRRGLA